MRIPFLGGNLELVSQNP
jgi:hypothetical protein